MQMTCATCLSQDRSLKPLKSIKLNAISLDSLNIDFIPPDSAICWECSAEVVRWSRFRHRAVTAQSTMRYVTQAGCHGLSNIYETLSTLAITPQKSIIHFISPDNVKSEIKINNDVISETLDKIKTETEKISDECLIDADYFQNDGIDDIPLDELISIVEVKIPDTEQEEIDKEKRKEKTPSLSKSKKGKYVTSTRKLRSKNKTEGHKKVKVKHKENIIKNEESESEDDIPLSLSVSKTKNVKNEPKKHVRFNLPATPITDEIKNQGSETESAFTDSDIEFEGSEKPVPKSKYHSSNKYNRGTFEIRKISLDRVQKNRKLDMRGRDFQKPFKCHGCIKGFNDQVDYLSHMERYHSKLAGPYKCEICTIRFTSEQRMKSHYNRHLQSYNCRKCRKFFHYHIRHMYIHDRRRHGADSVQTHVCRHCHKHFPTPATLSYHKKRTHSEQLWNSVTDKQPKKRTKFMRKSDHDPSQLPRCDICHRTFLSKHYLKKHIKNHAQPSRRQERECSQCGLKVRFLEAHIAKIHERNENAYCAECDIQFSSVFSYRNSHLKFSRRHNPQPDASKKTIPCPYCDKKWAHQRDLDRHVILIHTKDYPYICELCGKGFYFERRMKIHVREKHEGYQKPKDKVCTYCGKAFVHLQVLKQHIRVHTGEKPYECAHCPWRFSQRTSLVTHVKGKHPEHFSTTVIRKRKADTFADSED